MDEHSSEHSVREENLLPQFAFRLDPAVIAYHALICSGPDQFYIPNSDTRQVKAFQRAFWEKHREFKGKLTDQLNPLYIQAEGTMLSPLQQSAADQALALPPFAAVLSEAVGSSNLIATEWERNAKEVESLFKRHTDLRFPATTEVYVLHPAIKSGRNISGTIFWSYRNDWPNYNTVFLAHEGLHSVLPRTLVTHAAIELLTDEELRAVLNGDSYPPFVGHEEQQDLLSVKTKMLPDWRDYLLSQRRDFFQFTQEMEDKYHINSTTEEKKATFYPPKR